MPPSRAARARAALFGPIAALALSLPFLGAALASDDAAILGWVARHPPFADLTGPQFGLDSLRFWRPLMTLTFDVQESWTGARAWPLRLFNALAHAAAAGLAGLVARRVGAGTFGIAAAALWVATFPHQGGTTGWVSGRSDAFSLPLVMLAMLGVTSGRVWLAVVAGALAVMQKEMAWLQAPLAFALLLARGDGWRAALRGAWPSFAVVAVALAARPFLIGALIGGYGAPPPSAWTIASGAPLAWVRALSWSALFVGVLAAGAAIVRARAALLGLAAGVSVSLFGTAMLAQLVVGGAISSEHERAIHTPDALLGPFVAIAIAAVTRSGTETARTLGRVLALLLVALLAWRAVDARADLARWAAAGDQAEAEAEAARAEAERLGPSDAPLLDPRFSRLDPTGRAYVLHWGVADRFRAPFRPAPRPIWPWRQAFTGGDVAREFLGAIDGPAFDAAAPAREGLVDLVWSGAGVAAPRDGGLAAVAIRPAEFADDGPGPIVRVGGGEALAALTGAPRAEILLATEFGYVTGGLSADDALALFQEGLGMRAVLLAGGGRVFELLRFAVDFGADQGLVELRITTDDGAPLARTRFLRLVFPPELRAFLIAAR